MPALYSVREGYRAIAEAGPARIRATSKALTAWLVEAALERGLTVGTPLDPERRGGAVTIDLGERTEAVGARLIANGILVDHRPGAGIRVGPHFFNTIEECERLLGAL
jgi:kynureninase